MSQILHVNSMWTLISTDKLMFGMDEREDVLTSRKSQVKKTHLNWPSQLDTNVTSPWNSVRQSHSYLQIRVFKVQIDSAAPSSSLVFYLTSPDISPEMSNVLISLILIEQADDFSRKSIGFTDFCWEIVAAEKIALKLVSPFWYNRRRINPVRTFIIWMIKRR